MNITAKRSNLWRAYLSSFGRRCIFGAAVNDKAYVPKESAALWSGREAAATVARLLTVGASATTVISGQS
jgi:hypothetical protein